MKNVPEHLERVPVVRLIDGVTEARIKQDGVSKCAYFAVSKHGLDEALKNIINVIILLKRYK
jgi:hypothetical protein